MKTRSEFANQHRISIKTEITMEAAEWKQLLAELEEKEVSPEFFLALETVVTPIVQSIYDRVELKDTDSSQLGKSAID